MNELIFPITEVDSIIIDYLDPLRDYKNLSMISHYYHDLVNQNKIYSELVDFNKNFDKISGFWAINSQSKIFLKACKGEYVHLAKYFYDKHRMDVNTCIPTAFEFCCENGNLELVRWLFGIVYDTNQNLLTSMYLQYVCYRCCCAKYDPIKETERLEVFKFLIDVTIQLNRRIYFNAYWCNGGIFMSSCKNNHLLIIKYIVLIENDYEFPIGIHVKKEGAFRISCRHGCLEVVKWLVEYGISTNTPINIHAKHDYAFRKSCTYGHYEVAIFLYQISNGGIDISANNNEAFVKSCENGHYQIAQWLCTLSDKYHIYKSRINYSIDRSP